MKSARLLGVIHKDGLKWNDHVDYIMKKSAKRLYMLRLLKRARCDNKTLISVYCSCISPILDYCGQVWHHNLPEYLSKEIKRIQSRALKRVNPSLSYNESLLDLNIPTLFSRRELLCSNFIRKKVLLQISPFLNWWIVVIICAHQINSFQLAAGQTAFKIPSFPDLFPYIINISIFLDYSFYA